jgi:uncharacterized protein YndB with AHSA1/START domain
MSLFSQLVLSDSIEINTTPEKIWEFFTNLERNYKTWHPQDHVLFKWTKGKPMETGSCWYGEEVVRGKIFKLKGTIGEVIPNRKIVLKYSFPISSVAPRVEWLIEPKGPNSVFTAKSYLRAGGFFLKYFKKEMEPKLEMHYEHVRGEAENLKKFLEQ